MQLKNVISDLQVAARAARLQGDETAALAIEQSLNELKIDWPNISHALVEISFSATATRHRELDIAKWSILNPKAIHTSGLVSIIDCEGEGRITMIGGSILIRGSIAMEPMTALLIADHAKRNHNGKGTAFGSPEFLNNIAIANCATGTEIQVPGALAEDRSSIQQSARGWQPMVAEIHAVRPTRPARTAANGSPSAVSSLAVV